MFLVLKAKKLLLLLMAALLFLTVTVIIFVRTNESESLAVAAIVDTDPECVLIIDAGHGGADGGAVAADGTKESLINLAIAQKLEKAAQLFGVNTVMTRSSEEFDYPESADTIRKMKAWDQQKRAELINSTENAVMISIHQNYYPDKRPYGPQVLYGKVGDSAEFGELTNEALTVNIAPDNRRVAGPISDTIFLMKAAKCPAILVECGFISNTEELKKLLSDDYQKKIAAILLSSYISFIS